MALELKLGLCAISGNEFPNTKMSEAFIANNPLTIAKGILKVFELNLALKYSAGTEANFLVYQEKSIQFWLSKVDHRK